MLNRYFNAEENPDLIYANMVLKNIHFGLVALDYINNFNTINYTIEIYHDEHTYFFYHIQSLLTACGNISNIFYNYTRNRKSTERAMRMREIFGINKKRFPLTFQKEVRNTNEHFDERYDTHNGVLGDYNIIDRNTDQDIIDTINTNIHLRTFDRMNNVYITYNRYFEQIKYDLNELRNELKEMQKIIEDSPLFIDNWTNSINTDVII